MSERLFVGLINGRQLLRITPPGKDATNLATKSVLSSDGDYLSVHTVIDEVLNRNNNYHWGTYAYPALGYAPLAFISITHTSLNRVFYPNDRNPETSEMNNFWRWIVQDGRVWVGTDTPSSYGGNYRVRIILFKNKSSGFINV